ncbi:hypothetical protein M413DRAFT_340953 [Hebeloma cylindrosporum]|uniref:Uncharacterized protein n=1 Tax=Hebeloma cylindrosporum TaxID=76867 RepID=A0A0C2Y6G4_HEBCY|nr:hypothetical protein M413DRAFT_340953 [Hebeloma cylindrosporum h7]
MSVPYATPQRAGHASASSSSQQSFAPRSSSIPLQMGHTQSKPVPPLPSPSPATKGFNAAVAGGIKLKRAFAGRRKKSEDASSVFGKGKEQDSKPPVAPRIETSASAPPQVRSFSRFVTVFFRC